MPRIAATTATRATRTAKPVARVSKVKAPAKRAAKKTVVRRAKPELQVKPINYTFSKAVLINELAEMAGTDKATAKAVMQALEDLFLGTVHPKGAGTFSIPGILKVVTRKTKPQKGGVKKTNPLTGLEYVTKAKAATVRVRIRPGTKMKQVAAQ